MSEAPLPDDLTVRVHLIWMSGSRRHPKVRAFKLFTRGLGYWSEHSRWIGKFLSKAGCLFLRERACWAATLPLYESIGSCQKRLHIQQIRDLGIDRKNNSVCRHEFISEPRLLISGIA
jgi:hypothetical protein